MIVATSAPESGAVRASGRGVEVWRDVDTNAAGVGGPEVVVDVVKEEPDDVVDVEVVLVSSLPPPPPQPCRDINEPTPATANAIFIAIVAGIQPKN